MKPRVVSQQDEREIQALFEQSRTVAWDRFHRGLSFESEEDRAERLEHELKRRDREWVALVNQARRDRFFNRLFVIGISVLAFCAVWAMLAVFVWGGRPWPR